ncbi:hypothetical protein [Nitrospina gracilis]|uniref:hypothetical protein n=1 Tax=Nitrospina gracilis TaxID=35801 RepID=UPI001F21B86C|nr:hypothetical protein [Nitrospina gracilis]MCF8721780.1 hypothetical protein [Nitrospina gracilis Nb-211]
MSSPQWVGPFTIKQLLENCHNCEQEWPPDTNGVYVVSLKKWRGQPKRSSEVIYVGGNAGKSKRFATRIGDLFADIFGFYGGGTGHHSGGQAIYEFCNSKRTPPLELFIGWKKYLIDPKVKSSRFHNCPRCQELKLYEQFKGIGDFLNKYRPRKCKKHIKK